jgi:polar amino acid transport system substrate-binding protein
MKNWLLIFCAFALAACGPKKSADSTLVVGMDLDYPPFETIDASGRPAGVSVEMAEALGKFLGRPVRIENIPFLGLIPALQSGRINIVLSSMTDTPERRKSIAFSDPYFHVGLALLVAKDSPIQSIADIDQPGRTLVARAGTTGEIWARANLKNARLLTLGDASAAVLEVLSGRADGFLYDQIAIYQNWKQHPDRTRALLQPVRQEFLAIGLRLDDTALRDQVNAFIKQFRADGGFEKLGDKYLSEQKAAFKKLGIEFFF